jgi:imidazolonepropionase-like amidohydrolase
MNREGDPPKGAQSMRSRFPVRARVTLWSVAFGSALAALPASAESPDPPPYYAIQNVRVVTGSGTPIEGATVLLADGLIEAVGPNVETPADAWVIDGTGLSLYPGLIDALTTLGQKKEEEESQGGGRGAAPDAGDEPEIRGPEDRPATTPWVSAADELTEDKRIPKWRKAGFTSTVTTPEQGIFAGQAAFINLADGEGKQLIVAAPVAHRLNFGRQGRSRSFPGSLMGRLSYIKQVLSDTEHYTTVTALYADDPRGRIRPTYDRTLGSLETAIAGDSPFLMPGHLAREIDRALAIRDAYGLEGVIYGGQGAYARIDKLAAAETPVLVSLNWPEEEKDRDPESDTPFRTLYHRQMAPTTPVALAEAEIPFAFYSDGLATTSEIFEGVRAAIDAGLSHEDALAALSVDAAAIFGVSDRLGSIEEGKIANLVLATDWPWADDVEVAAVFVDGRKYQEHKDEEPKEAPAQDVTGSWSLTMQTPRGSREMTAELEMKEDGKVSGKIVGRQGDTALDEGRMSGDLLRFKTTREFGGRSMTASWSLTVEEEKIAGSMNAGPMQMDVSGERTSKPEAGEVAKKDSDKPPVAIEELRETMDVYQGRVRQMGTFAITNATIWTVSGETIERGTVVVRDGKIEAVGADVTIPRGAEVIDADGGSLIPGIIDAHSHIAVEGGVNEGSLAVTSMVAIGDVLNPDDIAIYRALAGGVTAANILHGSANPIGGQNAVIKLRWGSDAEGLKLEGAPAGIKFALGENPKRSNFRTPGRPARYPQTRMGVMDVIRQAFTEAREYQKEWQEYESRRSSRRGTKPMPPRRDLELEALVEILEGKRLVHSHCYRADEILQLLRLAEEFGFRIATLQHVLEGYKVADEIAEHGAGASTFSDWWGYKVEAYDAIPYNAALMAERDVLVTINSDSGEEMRHLNQEAAKAVKWGGMEEKEALKLVTLNAAKQLGVDHLVGSIEVGKDADLVLYDGHPLSMLAVVQKTFIDGDLYFDIEADRERQARVDAVKERLQGKGDEGEAITKRGGSTPPPEVHWQDGPYSCRGEK